MQLEQNYNQYKTTGNINIKAFLVIFNVTAFADHSLKT
jgi:hypothetical protein